MKRSSLINQLIISIIVPVYNVQEYLPRCINSILSQSYQALDVILVDDGSSDESGRICDAYGAQDERVRVIHKINGGLSSARNAGLLIALGEYVLFVDSDDYIERDACKRFADIARTFRPDFVIGDAEQIIGDTSCFMTHSCLREGRVYEPNELIQALVKAKEWYAPSWINCYSKSFLLSNNLLFCEGILHEDMEIQPRIYLESNRVSYMRYPFYKYVTRTESIMTSDVTTKRVNDMKCIYSQWYRAFMRVDDLFTRKALLGHLCKCYLYTCRTYGREREVHVEGITRRFLLKHSLGVSEKAKALLYSIFPGLYYRLK